MRLAQTLQHLLCAACVATGLLGAAAHAADFPTKPISILLPFGVGGSLDSVYQTIARGLQAALGQPVLLVPATGASGTIAANTVRTAVPDGHTLFSSTISGTSS